MYLHGYAYIFTCNQGLAILFKCVPVIKTNEDPQALKQVAPAADQALHAIVGLQLQLNALAAGSKPPPHPLHEFEAIICGVDMIGHNGLIYYTKSIFHCFKVVHDALRLDEKHQWRPQAYHSSYIECHG